MFVVTGILDENKKSNVIEKLKDHISLEKLMKYKYKKPMPSMLATEECITYILMRVDASNLDIEDLEIRMYIRMDYPIYHLVELLPR